MKISPQELVAAFDRMEKKLDMALTFEKTTTKLNGNVKLIRIRTPFKNRTIADDYGLSEIFAEEIKVVQVPGDHSTIFQTSQSQIAEVIDEFFTSLHV